MNQPEGTVIELQDKRKLGYSEYGDSKGKPLFYFHGWPSGRLMGAETDLAAKKLGVRVISPDRPGYGSSDFQENRTLLGWPDDVLEIADQLGVKRFSVIGVSGGGPYAAVCGYKISQRLNKMGIVVRLAPTYIPEILEGMAISNELSWTLYLHSGWVRNIAAWSASMRSKYLPILNNTAFIATSDRKMFTSEFNQAIKRNAEDSFRQGIKGPAWDLNLYTHDWGFDLKDITVPTFLWYGEEDKNVGLVMGKYYHSQIPGSTLTTYPNEGHFCRMNHEEEILRALI